VWWLTAANDHGSKRDYEKRPQIILQEDEGPPSFALRTATTTAGSSGIYLDGSRWVNTKRASHGRRAGVAIASVEKSKINQPRARLRAFVVVRRRSRPLQACGLLEPASTS
jgi:hypothetical protein